MSSINMKALKIFPILFVMNKAGAVDVTQETSAKIAPALGAEIFLSDDSEGFQTHKLSAEFFPKFEDANQYLGIRASAYKYKIDNWDVDGQKVSLIAKSVDPLTTNGWYVDAGFFNQGNHGLFTFDGSYRTNVADQTAVEVFANRDWVETKPALDNGTHFTFVGLSADQSIGRHVTLVGLAGSQFFSDDNRRDHGRLKVIYQPSLDLGLTLQGRYRTYHSQKEDVNRVYFNPKNYEEAMFAIGWRKRFSGWTTGLTAGVGREKINNDPSQNTRLIEISAQSPLNRSQYLNFSAGYNRSASYYGADYNYRYIKGEWILRF